MASLSQEKIGDFVFQAPPIYEQQAISNFLDTQCSKIDSIISDLEQQMEILNKYKKYLPRLSKKTSLYSCL
ncbi:MAG: hypothetical protein A2Y24_05070 [Clostridiales bacterium GWE2_32_10]|nr:MAG: hypothetical protein A2Y24_05070 [Clostridiales bacterium GWE2_32_10]HBY20562.1 hypothetical protein [Clostridiales bacterium]